MIQLTQTNSEQQIGRDPQHVAGAKILPAQNCLQEDAFVGGDADGEPSSFVSVSLVGRLVTEIRQQSGTILATILTLFFGRCPWLISLRFVGMIGPHELAAAALATTILNVTGMSFAVGLNSALTTLAGQARGDLQRRCRQQQDQQQDQQQAQHQLEQCSEGTDEIFEEITSLLSDDDDSLKKSAMIGNPLAAPQGSGTNEHTAKLRSSRTKTPLLPLVYLYRALLVQCLFVLPIGTWWIMGVKPVLLALGQGPELSSMAEAYLRILAPSLWCYAINWTLTAWLQTLEMAEVPAYGTAAGLILHIPVCILFVDIFGFGYLGTAMATVVFQSIQLGILLSFMFLYPAGRKRTVQQMAAAAVGRNSLSFWPEARLALSWVGIEQYLRLAIPGMVLISEWWASEVAIFLSGHLLPHPQLALGGMAIYQTVNTFSFQFPVACAVAGATRVGNLLGAGRSRDASFASTVSVLNASLVSSVCAAVIFFTPRSFFPSLFAPREDALIEETGKTFTLLSIYVLGDGIQSALTGIIKGCGRQAITMPIVVISYWVIGLPLAYYLAFVKNDGIMCDDNYFCGNVGLVAGMTTGTWVHMILLGFVVFGTTDWAMEANKVKARLDSHHATKE